ncbi:MAG: hypothetical protein PHE55_11500 [Methylococcaceae bacterium]|nr:hypothetical protein [Methylococcaceae bacterium]
MNRRIDLKVSENAYDWLGPGVYFWENNYERARQYAEEDKQRTDSTIKEPFVIGAVLDLGHCFDLLEQQGLDFLSFAYEEFKKSCEEQGEALPSNKPFGPIDFDFKKRELDCAVIQTAHSLYKRLEGTEFDSVRAAFFEGDELYPGAGFKMHNHIQIAVKDSCIKGIFLPREETVLDPWAE